MLNEVKKHCCNTIQAGLVLRIDLWQDLPHVYGSTRPARSRRRTIVG
jgi:hypothetical protein